MYWRRVANWILVKRKPNLKTWVCLCTCPHALFFYLSIAFYLDASQTTKRRVLTLYMCSCIGVTHWTLVNNKSNSTNEIVFMHDLMRCWSVEKWIVFNPKPSLTKLNLSSYMRSCIVLLSWVLNIFSQKLKVNFNKMNLNSFTCLCICI